MQTISTRPLLASQDRPAHLATDAEWKALCQRLCPRGHTCIGFSNTLQQRVLIGTRCGTFACPHCGPRKQQRMAIMTELACPNRLITLTVNPKFYASPREAFDNTRRQLAEMSKRLRLILEEFEYLRVLEATAKGWPHYHLVARCPFIKQSLLSSLWRQHTGAPIVDIRMIDSRQGVFGYVCKYLSKQQEVPWTKRRISWTRNFFVKVDRPDTPGLQLQRVKMDPRHVEEVLRDLPAWTVADQLTDNVFIIKEWRPSEERTAASP